MRSNKKTPKKGTKAEWSDQDDAFFGPTKPSPPTTKVPINKRINNKSPSSSLPNQTTPSSTNKGLLSDLRSKATSLIPPPPSGSVNNRLSLSRRLKRCLLTQVPMSCKYCHSLIFDFYQYHPFFGATQRICGSHDQSSVICCAACQRYLSKDHPVEMNRIPLCGNCETTVILHDGQLQKLYDTEVMEFLSVTYNLTLYRDRMACIPIRLVDEAEMERISSGSTTHPHFGRSNDPHAGHSAGIKKYGLCVTSEWETLYGSFAYEFTKLSATKRSTTSTLSSTRGGSRFMPSFGASSSSRGSNKVKIKGILIQRGLPSPLTAAILVHEAIHAWFALNPLRKASTEDGRGRIPSQIEEGCCQLVSHLYLRHIIAKENGTSGIADWNKKKDTDIELKECFRWQIETHTSEVYGDGFRKAAVAYERMCENGGGLLTLLEYVCSHLDLPPPGP